MTVPEVICKTVDMQNNSQWPCCMCPIPQFRPEEVRTSHIFLIFPGHPEFWTPLQIPLWGPPGCTLLQPYKSSHAEPAPKFGGAFLSSMLPPLCSSISLIKCLEIPLGLPLDFYLGEPKNPNTDNTWFWGQRIMLALDTIRALLGVGEIGLSLLVSGGSQLSQGRSWATQLGLKITHSDNSGEGGDFSQVGDSH